MPIYDNFPTTLANLFRGVEYTWRVLPITLGGTSGSGGGSGGAPGGFIGQLAQKYVAGDSSELRTLTSGSVGSLVDNLNNIRYWETFQQSASAPSPTFAGQMWLNTSGSAALSYYPFSVRDPANTAWVTLSTGLYTAPNAAINGTVAFVSSGGNLTITQSSGSFTFATSGSFLPQVHDINGLYHNGFPLRIAGGGTNTTTTPTAGALLIGTSGGGYAVNNLIAGSNTIITNSSGSITISSNAGGGVNLDPSTPLDIAGSASVGSSGSAAHGDHVHRGVHGLYVAPNTVQYGDIALVGSGINTVTQSSGSFTFSSSGSTYSPLGAVLYADLVNGYAEGNAALTFDKNTGVLTQTKSRDGSVSQNVTNTNSGASASAGVNLTSNTALASLATYGSGVAGGARTDLTSNAAYLKLGTVSSHKLSFITVNTERGIADTSGSLQWYSTVNAKPTSSAGIGLFPGTNSGTNFTAQLSPDSLSANQTFTFPNTSGSVVVGGGSQNGVSYWTGANTIASSGSLTFNTTTLTAAALIVSNPTLLIGETTPVDTTALLEGTSNSAAAGFSSFIHSSSGSTDAPYFALYRSRGTLASPTKVVDEDRVGSFYFNAYDGSAYQTAALIRGEMDINPTSGSMPGRLMFYTTAGGSVTPTERMRITSGGNVLIGTTTKENSTLVQISSNTGILPAGVAGSVLQLAQADGTNTRFEMDAFGAIPIMDFRRSNNKASSPTALALNDIMGSFGAYGYGATSLSSGARGQLRFNATQAWTDANQGTNITFFTTPNNAAAAALAFTIDQDKTLALVGKIATYNNVATAGYGVPAIVDSVALTNQGADIGSTNFANSSTAGMYRINYYLFTTTSAGGTGTLPVTITWNDGTTARSEPSASISLTSTAISGRTYGSFIAELGSGSIAYATQITGSYLTAKYALYITVERLT